MNDFDTDEMDFRVAGSRKFEMLLDPIWDNETRTHPDFFAAFLGLADVGGKFYAQVYDQFDLPSYVEPPSVQSGVPIHSVVADYTNGVLLPSEDDNAEAVGSDGTIYRVTYHSPDRCSDASRCLRRSRPGTSTGRATVS